MARRDPLDASLTRLCSLAEQALVLLRQVERARDGLRHFRFDPDALAAQLDALAQAGRQAHSDRLDARRADLVADEEARAAAQAAYDLQADLRKRLTAVSLLADDRDVADDLDAARRRLSLSRPRLTSALDTFRRFGDHVRRPDHPVHAHPATVDIPAEVAALVARLETAVDARAAAERLGRVTSLHADDARADLRHSLRRLRQMGDLAATVPGFPEAVLGFLQTRAVRVPVAAPCASDDPSDASEASDAPETPPEGAPMPLACASIPLGGAPTPLAGAPTPPEGARTPREGARTPPEGARTSNADNSACSEPD